MERSETYTLEQCINFIGLGKYQWRLIAILGFCSMADGIEMMLLAILGPALTCDWPEVTQFQIASLSTGVFAGMMLGSFVFGIIADKYGRQRVIMASAVVNTIFGIFTAFAPSYYWILLARSFVGVALAGAAQGSTLLLEYLPTATRATIPVMIQVFWSVGSIFEYLVAMIVVPISGWRLLTILSAIPITIVAVFMYFVPESPRYFVVSGQPEKAEHLLKAIALTNKRPLPPGRLLDVNAQDECGSIKQLFHVNYRRSSFLLAYMWTTVAMSYYGIILINTSLMTLEKVDLPSNATSATSRCKMLTTKDYQSLMLTTVGEMLGIPLLVILLGRYGRCRICFLNYFFAAICFSLLLFVRPNQSWLINVITFAARMFINSQFSLIYLYTMEVYPTVIRAMAVGCASAMARIGAMITPYLAQVLIKKTFHGTIMIYVVVSALAAVCSLLLPIETRGRELKQATSDHNPPSAVSKNVTAPSWLAAVEGITSFVQVNDPRKTEDYRPLIQEENTDDEQNEYSKS